ncbi:radical SAM protein [Clostridium botulinum]|uniref:radical SAM protein n=1 Tax=Clostridium botulinum TaxID=1491 RepID=UPI00052CF7C8|nr:radical SAM protein [Clostridium botulinum]KGM94129.1 Fe-S oxidoreductase [Clostridium botulinum D str. CCUG 7971]NFO97794.1 radical SAM protein [Clostridium botulinum]OOV52724.1 radical SAM protein [Clostridium botulinum D/C]OOV53916.1 radical SAM protein [Clostridium botulinum D/C]OOV56799.1 radical SAM protein [Clostridium botulinum D/C]
MQNEISKVLINSIAEEVEIEVGDRLASINGTEVKDIIDYKYLIVDDYVVIEVEKRCGEIWEIEIEKEFGEDIGIEFKDPMLDRPKNCHNKCIFCFIDQLPKGMRDTLYFKDDDSRLSFLQGNFITMTNMSEDDIDRIIKYRISPINISVHTTNPKLRCKMMNNRFAGTIYDRLKRITDAKIDVNCQIVLCPGYNDKEELDRTILDLYKLYPYINNLAVVPIGVTKFRKQNGLVKLELFNEKTASEEIDRVARLQERFMKEIGEPFVRLSDEFYVIAGRDVPDDKFYNGFQQLEDGVGMIRNFRDHIEKNLHKVRKDVNGKFTMVTGASAYKEIKHAADKIMSKNPNIKIDVRKIINNFFGETITVAGLLTGQDIIEQLSKVEIGDYIIMSDNMFKKGYELGNYEELIMLDDVKIYDLEKALQRKVIVCDYTGEDLIELINTYSN